METNNEINENIGMRVNIDGIDEVRQLKEELGNLQEAFLSTEKTQKNSQINYEKYYNEQSKAVEKLYGAFKNYQKAQSKQDNKAQNLATNNMLKYYNVAIASEQDLTKIKKEDRKQIQAIVEAQKQLRLEMDKTNKGGTPYTAISEKTFKTQFGYLEKLYAKQAELQKLRNKSAKGTDFNTAKSTVQDNYKEVTQAWNQNNSKVKREFVQSVQEYKRLGHDLNELNIDIRNKYAGMSRTKGWLPIDEVSTYKDTIKSVEKEIDDLQIKIHSAEKNSVRKNVIISSEQLTSIISKIKELENAYEELQDKMSKSSVSSGTEQTAKANEKIAETASEATQETEKLAKAQKEATTTPSQASGKLLNEEEIKELLTILNSLNDNLLAIKNSVGSVDDNDGFTNIVSSLKELHNWLSTASSSMQEFVQSFKGLNLNIDFGSNQNASLDKYLKERLAFYEARYNNIFKSIDKDGNADALWSGLANSQLVSAKYGDADQIKNVFSQSAILQVENLEDRLSRITTFLQLVKDVRAANLGDGGFWDSFAKSATISDNTVSEIRSNINKLKSEVNTGDAKLENLFSGVNLEGVSGQLQEIISKLTDLKKVEPTKHVGLNNSDISKEQTELETLEQKVKEVATAVDAKSTAFTQEKVAVETAVQKEISDLNELLEKINKIEASVKELADIPIKINVQTPENIDNNISEVFEKLKTTLSGDFINSLNTLSTALQGLKLNKSFSDNLQNAATGIATFRDELGKIDSNGSGFLKEINELLSKGDELKNLANVLNSTKKQIQDAKKAISDNVSINDIDELSDADKNAYVRMYQQAAEYEQQEKDYIKQRNVALAEGTRQAKEYANLQQKAAKELSKFDINNPNLTKNYADRRSEIENKIGSINDFKSYETIKKELRELSKDIRADEKELAQLGKTAKETFTTKLTNQWTKWLENNSAASEKTKLKIRELIAELKQVGTTDIRAKEIVAELNKIATEAREAGETGKSFFDQWSSRMRSLAVYLSSFVGFQDLINGSRDVISEIKALDFDLLDVKKTFQGSNSELINMYNNSAPLAKQLGVTAEAIINQEASWSRLGYSTKEQAETMAELSSQFASISPGMDIDTSTEGLVSIMKAWQLDVSDVKSVMDNINILGNSFAESNEDIVNGMERSAAALAATGTSYQDAFALFTGAQEVLQNAEVGGRALRSISMRIHGYSENSEDGLLEADSELKNITGDLIDLTKTAEHTNGVSIFKDGSTTEFKSLVDYFGEINAIWDEMDQKQQNDFLQKAFGKTQAQAGAALIQNYDAVRSSLEQMKQSAGSADREMESVEATIDYKLNALAQTWTQTWQQTVSRDSIGNIVDGLTKISEGLGWILEKTGLLAPLLSGLFTGISMKNGGGFVINKQYLLS